MGGGGGATLPSSARLPEGPLIVGNRGGAWTKERVQRRAGHLGPLYFHAASKAPPRPELQWAAGREAPALARCMVRLTTAGLPLAVSSTRPLHPQPSGWATNPPIRELRIPSSNTERVRTPGGTNRHTHSALNPPHPLCSSTTQGGISTAEKRRGRGLPPPPPPPKDSPRRPRFQSGKNIDLGHFWNTNFWVPAPPAPAMMY